MKLTSFQQFLLGLGGLTGAILAVGGLLVDDGSAMIGGFSMLGAVIYVAIFGKPGSIL